MPRKRTPRDITELPEWMKSLKGYESLVPRSLEDAVATEEPSYPSGTWRIFVMGATDPSEATEMDPLLQLGLIANASFQLEARLEDLARFCRSQGKTWTQIGEVLGMSKQAAWERFSGEE